MDIVLHLGAHRCASTTFQSFLWANRVLLARRGLTCWTPRRTRNGLLVGMLRHPALISIEDEKKCTRSVGRIRVEIDRLSKAGQKGLVISEENIIGSMRNNLLDTQLYPLVGERVHRFKPAFEGQKLTIGFCIRSYEDFWSSCMANLIVRGGAMPTPDLLNHLSTQPRRWRHVVRDIAATFPDADVVVYPFERLANRPELQLQALWDGDCQGLARNEIWRNKSVDLRGMNELLILRGEHPLAQDTNAPNARWMPFDESQRIMHREEYQRDLAWLNAGADGLARYVDGPTAPDRTCSDGRSTPASHKEQPLKSGQSMSTIRPDRARMTRTSAPSAVPLRGQTNGIEKGMDRAGAS